MSIVIKLDASYFQHAILIVDDLYENLAHDDIAIERHKDWLQNISVYVGESPYFWENTICLGGPFLETDVDENYFEDVVYDCSDEDYC